MLFLSLVPSALGAFLSTNELTTTASFKTVFPNFTDVNTITEDSTVNFGTENSTTDNSFLGTLK